MTHALRVARVPASIGELPYYRGAAESRYAALQHEPWHVPLDGNDGGGAHVQLPDLRLTNIVVKYRLLARPCDGGDLVRRLPGAHYAPHSFPAVIVKVRNRCVLIFTSGIAISPGHQTTVGAKTVAQELVNSLLRVGYLAEMRAFRVNNYVCTTHAGFQIDIKAISEAYDTQSSYGDEFPGLIFYFSRPKVTMTTYVNGVVNVAGARTEHELYCCWRWYYTRVLTRFQLASAARRTSTSSYRQSVRRRTAVSFEHIVARHQQRVLADAIASHNSLTGAYLRRTRRRDAASSSSAAAPATPYTPRGASAFDAVVRVAVGATAPSAHVPVSRTRARLGAAMLTHADACPCAHIASFDIDAEQRAIDALLGAWTASDADGDAALRVLGAHVDARCIDFPETRRAQREALAVYRTDLAFAAQSLHEADAHTGHDDDDDGESAGAHTALSSSLSWLDLVDCNDAMAAMQLDALRGATGTCGAIGHVCCHTCRKRAPV